MTPEQRERYVRLWRLGFRQRWTSEQLARWHALPQDERESSKLARLALLDEINGHD